MKQVFILTVLLMLCSMAFAWNLVRQSAFPVNFYTIDIVDHHIWAGGSSGGVAKSVDDGHSWDFVPSPFFNSVTGVYRTVEDLDFYDQNHGIMVGSNGTIAITADGGESWTVPSGAQSIIGTTGLYSCVYHSTGNIWICGASGKIAYSYDHGQTWVQQTSPLNTILYGMSMNENGIGFITCNKGTPDQSKILRTTDFGNTWTVVELPVLSNPSIYNVRQYGSKVILVGDFGYLGVSDDYGVTWTHHSYAAGNTTNDELHDVVMYGNTGYAVGWYNRILKTTDGWATYTPISSNWSGSHLEGVVVNALGELVSSGWLGVLSISTDGANTWVDSVPSAIDLYQISMVDANTWYMTGDKGYILKTVDGGRNFDRKKISGMDDILSACHFFDANTGLVTGKSGGRIFRTTNGGESWTEFTIAGITTQYLYDFHFLNQNTGYLVGLGGKVAKTTDAGLTWTLTGDNIVGTEVLYCNYWTDQQTGYAGGTQGKLYYSTNGGVTWSNFVVGATGTAAKIRDIHFRDANNGVLVKENGEIWYTTTGGFTANAWIAGVESATSQICTVTSDHRGTYWAGAYSNGASQSGTQWMMMKSVDNGATWTQEPMPELTFNPGRIMNMDIKRGLIVAVGRNNIVYSHLLPPERVTLVSPPNNTVNANPYELNLSWNPSPNGAEPTLYYVFMSDDESTILDQFTFETSETSIDIVAAMWTYDQFLDYNKTWFWAVEPINAELVTPGPISDDFMVWNFTTMDDPFLPLQTPIVSIEKMGEQIRIHWMPVPNALSYKILGCTTPNGVFEEITSTQNSEHIIIIPDRMEFFKVIASPDLPRE